MLPDKKQEARKPPARSMFLSGRSILRLDDTIGVVLTFIDHIDLIGLCIGK